jgi:UDP-3-O-acyl-N-acetylglucosamine deacetylase
VVGHLEATKAGHALHAALALKLRQTPDAWTLVAHPALPVLDLSAPPALVPEAR